MVVRIVQGGSRRPRHLWVRMGYLGSLIGLVLIGLLSGGGLGQEVSLTDLAKAGTWVFAIIAYGQVVLICLLAPLFMAGAIDQERAGQTFNILLTTPLSNLQIVLGSLVGRLFFIYALLLSGLPLFAVLLIFGGVPIRSVFISFTVAALVALMVGAIAVAMSVLRLGGRKAVFTFVIITIAYLVSAYTFDAGLLRRINAVPNTTTWLTPLHPLLVMEASLNSANYRPPGAEYLAGYNPLVRFYLGRPFAAFSTLTLLVSAFLVVMSATVLRQVGQGEARWLRWVRRKLRLPVTGGEKRHAPRDVWANPIAWREANTRGKMAAGILGRWGFAVVAMLAGVGLLIAYHFSALPYVPDGQGRALPQHMVFHSALMALLLLEVGVVTLVALYMSAGCVSREREDGTLDLMLTTPMTPRQYIWGKLRGLISFLLLLIAAPVVTVTLVSLYAVVGYLLDWPQAQYTYSAMLSGGSRITRQPLLMLPEAPLLLLGMLVPFVALCVMTGMSWSLKARGVLGAVVPSIAVIGVLSLVLGFCGWSAAEQVPLVGPAINALSPATNLIMIVNPWEHVSGFAESPLAGRLSLAIGALIGGGLYAVVVYAMQVGMVKGFDHTVRRLSGG